MFLNLCINSTCFYIMRRISAGFCVVFVVVVVLLCNDKDMKVNTKKVVRSCVLLDIKSYK